VTALFLFRIVGGMDAVDREELIGMMAEALMRDAVFRPRRRNWAPMRIDAGRGAPPHFAVIISDG
jgi:hypothetical protein